MSYLDLLKLAAPEAILVTAALAVLGVDLLVTRGDPAPARRLAGAAICCAGCFAALFWMVQTAVPGSSPEGMLIGDSLTRWLKAGLLVLILFAVVLAAGSTFTPHIGEYYALLLLAGTGMLLMAGTENLLVIFLALELTSLSLYILVAFDKRAPASAEAALKYFLIGGMSAAFTLFGISWIYGLTGTIDLPQIAAALAGAGFSPLLAVALVATVIGFGFKVAAVPFHLWAPDAYQGAPTPSAGFIASGSKVASFFLFAKVLLIGFAGLEGSAAWRGYQTGWMPVIALIAVLSMGWGNLAALAQENVKRLLAYSAVAHAGYTLVGVLGLTPHGIAAVIYYSFTYGLTVLGAFGVVAMVESRQGDSQITRFAGFGRVEPAMAFCLMIFILSLAGIPPLPGFVGKFYLFAAALKAGDPPLGLAWLVALAILLSTISVYYYLQVLKQMYVREPAGPGDALAIPLTGKLAVLLLALSVLLLGCAPDLIIRRIQIAVEAARWTAGP